MQSTLDRRVMALMLRAARRQQAARVPAPNLARSPSTLPARLTEDRWWLNAPEPVQAARIAAAPRLVAINDMSPAEVSADE
jgi:hypothetical protein